MFATTCIVVILIFLIELGDSIRNVQLLVPPLVRAGSSATLLCLYDLEHAPLYSVKWYRGQHEFFRFMPTENPPTKVFQIAGIYVDIYTSNQHQVTLHNVPTFISGEVSCEITTDAPAISTACAADKLNVKRLDIDLHVPLTEYGPGETLTADCAASTAAKLSFYLNSFRVAMDHVTQGSASSATLNLTLTEDHFEPRGDLRLQCSGGISDQYYISTRLVTIRRRMDRSQQMSRTSTLSISYLSIVCILMSICIVNLIL